MIPAIRNIPIFKYFRDYFPAKLIVHQKLDEFKVDENGNKIKKKYIFGAHPHGIICISMWANIFCDVSGVRDMLKGIDYRVATLGAQYKIPIFRDWVLSFGGIPASRESIVGALNKDLSVMIIIGGAAEALHARPGVNTLVLQNRKGFVKLALQTGSDLVPMYNFGENSLFVQLPNEQGTKVRHWQEIIKKKIGMSTPIFHGRGMLNYDFGLLPFRKPLITIIGKPIEVPLVPSPSPELVDEYHKKYVEGLKELYNEYKLKLNLEDEGELQIA